LDFPREKSSPPLTPFSFLQVLKTSKLSSEGVAIVQYQKVHNNRNSDEKNNNQYWCSVGSGTCVSIFGDAACRNWTVLVLRFP